MSEAVLNFFSAFLGVSRPVDIFYLVDVSAGATRESLNSIKGFLTQQGVVNSISSDGIRMSLVSYNDAPKTLLSLNQGTNVPALKNALAKMIPEGGSRRIDKALERVKNIIENRQASVRKNAGKVVVLFFNGKIEASELLRAKNLVNDLMRMGVRVAVVGIGSDLTKPDVQALTARDDNAFVIPSAAKVQDAVPFISSTVANSVKRPFKLDIGFIIGASGANARKDFALGKQVIISILKQLEIGPDQHQVGLIVYGSDVGIILRLNTAPNQDRAIEVVNRMGVVGDGRTLGQAIDLSRQDLFNEAYEARKGVPKLALIFVNQDIDRGAQNAAKNLAARGINVVFVSLGDALVQSGIRGMSQYRVRNQEESMDVTNSIITSILPGILIQLLILIL